MYQGIITPFITGRGGPTFYLLLLIRFYWFPQAPRVTGVICWPTSGFRNSNPLLASIWRHILPSGNTKQGSLKAVFREDGNQGHCFCFGLMVGYVFQREKIWKFREWEVFEVNFYSNIYERCLTCVMKALQIYMIQCNILAVTLHAH